MHNSLLGRPSPARLQPPVNIDGWPPAVRSAELARGTLVRCGPGVRLASWPDTAEVRADALRRVIGGNLMPVLMASAWVWGCARDPGSPIICATQGGSRPKLQQSPMLRVHEFHYPLSDLAVCGSTLLPGPVRTACDLVRLTSEFNLEVAVATRLLILRAAISRDEWETAIANGPGRNRVRAMRRIASISS